MALFSTKNNKKQKMGTTRFQTAKGVSLLKREKLYLFYLFLSFQMNFLLFNGLCRHSIGAVCAARVFSREYFGKILDFFAKKYPFQWVTVVL